MQAIILAAGMGKRLKDLTKNNTKCMIKVNGVTLIERVLNQLEKLHLSRIVIVVGYKGKELIEYIATLNVSTPICYIENSIYDKTNNIYSLSLAQEYLKKEDTILLESDLIFEDSVLQTLVDDSRETLALVDHYESWMDGTCLKLGKDDSIEAFVPGKKLEFKDTTEYYKTVNIYKFSQHFSVTHYVPFLEAYSQALGNNEYYEQVLRVIAMLDDPEIKAKKLEGQKWYEIDDVQDLDIASSIFATDKDVKVKAISSRYGGYWRYPKLKDFCYLVNPYFPPQRMLDEIKANFEILVTQCPSGMRVNRLLVAKNFGLKEEHVLVGNGAAELIKALMEKQQGKIGIIRPTFEEYANRCKENQCVVFEPDNEDFSYRAEDLMMFFEKKDITSLVLINPDNPSGNYISKQSVIELIEWCKNRGIQLIVDESFIDFAEEENNTLLDEEIMQKYNNLVVVKSLSKSYGIPGLRLGILASSDEKLMTELSRNVAIWNINSFAEFYLQIAEKYKQSYEDAMQKFKQVRKKYIDDLQKIAALRVIPSQANYVMVEILNGMTAKELTTILLEEHDLLIKDLSAKTQRNGKQFVRLAVRREEENNHLIIVLQNVCKNLSS
ncbi:MAG: aminotransferase class I/II-fold pyridoxal phosphate-dependent enzyme [Lachnospiraceae bacterium]